ncbi:MAG: AAA domain-containing protein [Streptosporangiaceae bacterium]
MGGRPQWLGEVIDALTHQLRVQGGDTHSGPGDDRHTDRAGGNLRRLALAVPDAEAGDGWFRVDVRGERLIPDRLEGSCLAPYEGPARRAYRVMRAYRDGTELVVEVGAHAPAAGLYLWISRVEPAFRTRSLRADLEAIDRFDLVGRFGSARLDPVPEPGAAPSGLLPEQARAWAACCASGLHLVWGPPGTGATHVVACALRQLLARGQSVLLVSGSGAVVDDVLERLPPTARSGSGPVIRVGTARLPAGDPRTSLSRLVRERLGELEESRRSLEAEILTSLEDPELRRLEETRAALAGFDHTAYRESARRIAARDRAGVLRRERAHARDALATARSEAKSGARVYEHAERAWAEIADARAALAEAARLRAAVRECEELHDQARAEAEALEAERDALRERQVSLATVGAVRRLRGLGERRYTADRLDQVEAALRRAAAGLATTGRRLTDEVPRLRERMAACERRARPVTYGEVECRLAVREAAKQRLDHARERQRERLAAVGRLERELEDAARTPAPDERDVDRVVAAERAGIPARTDALARLEESTAPARRRLVGLEREHERVLKSAARRGAEVERELVTDARVIATTLDGLRLTEAVRDRAYDHVIVDDAAAATVPEIIDAVSRATVGATLLGDFLQSGPRLEVELERSDVPEVRHWLATDCFALYGVTDPSAARRTFGCVCLTGRYRFGPRIGELLNRTAYGGTLTPSGSSRGPGPTARDPQIVFVDIDGLAAGLAETRRGLSRRPWWPIGALLARALAERHVAAESVGIVAPYADQVSVDRELLRDVGASVRVEVAHAEELRGRRFDVAVFDLVEGGGGDSWVARGRLRGSRWELAGLRTFVVGVTRARRRLYVIGSGAALNRTARGPIGAVGQLVDTGAVSVVRVRDVLGRPDAAGLDGPSADLWEALRPHVARAHDEALAARVDESRERLWLCTPWGPGRARRLLPSLLAARDRGVDVDLVVVSERAPSVRLREHVLSLRREFPNATLLHRARHPILVIDGRVAHIGGLAAAGSHSAPGPLALVAESRTLAARVLERENAAGLHRPPRCPVCGGRVLEVAQRGYGKSNRWMWVCGNDVADDRCTWTDLFRPPGRGRQRHP